MKIKNLVSIIVPVYNAEKYIETCVDSILGQTWPDIEVILVDDGSRDCSEEVIIRKYGTDERVRYYKKDNGGVSSARNAGLKLVRGEYISFVDADDWIAGDFVEKAVNWINSEGLDLVLGGTVKVYPDREELCCADQSKELWIYDDPAPVRSKVLSNGIFPRELRSCFTSGVVCRIFRREILEKVWFEETLAIGEDTVFNMDSMKYAKRIGVTGRTWYYYRMHDHSATGQRRTDIRTETERLMSVLFKKYGSDPGCGRYLAVRGIQQFYGMLLLDALHKESLFSLPEQCRYIRTCLSEEIWRNVFALSSIRELPANVPDRMLFWLVKKSCPWGIWMTVRLRVWGKTIAVWIRSR